MAKAISFTFDSYAVDDQTRSEVDFTYVMHYEGDFTTNFTEKLVFPTPLPQNAPTERLLQALHIALGISYYKVFLPPEFNMQYELSQFEADFWNNVYRNGLGEFLYTNKLPASRLAKFNSSSIVEHQANTIGSEAKAILGIGGGKDSALAGELLKSVKVPIVGYVFGTGSHHGQTEQVAQAMGIKLLGVQRTLDKQLIELNENPDAYNGHIPISLIYALCGLLLCVAAKARYMIVANEASASLPQTQWEGKDVNHQWSKSFELEKALQVFVHKTVTTDIDYFSAIRPLSSVAVMKLFSQLPQYFEVFTSCNRVFLIDPAKRPNDRWCGECAKDLSTFILLAPWVNEDQLMGIFGKNLLDDALLEKLFLELTGLEGHRPLDCVGTEDEAILSLNLAYQQGKLLNTRLMKVAKERGLIKDKDWQAELTKALTPSEEHALPETLKEDLLQIMTQRLSV